MFQPIRNRALTVVHQSHPPWPSRPAHVDLNAAPESSPTKCRSLMSSREAEGQLQTELLRAKKVVLRTVTPWTSSSLHGCVMSTHVYLRACGAPPDNPDHPRGSAPNASLRTFNEVIVLTTLTAPLSVPLPFSAVLHGSTRLQLQ